MTLGDSWKTDTSRTDPMRKSLVERAMKRKVLKGKDDNSWIVLGREDLGDKYPEYLVKLQDDGTFFCDCHTSGHGDQRRARGCSHVTRVMIFRRDGEEGVEGPQPDSFGSSGTGRPKKGKKIVWKGSPASSSEVEVPLESQDPLAETDELEEEGNEVEEEATASTKRLLDLVPLPKDISIIGSEPPMPERFETYRDDQWDAVLAVEEAFASGFKVVMLSAPVGSGKTLLAESVRRKMGLRALYTCTTKSLQDQVMRDYGDYAKVIKGRSNYPTLDDPNATADDCTKRKMEVPACQRCPSWQMGQSWNLDVPAYDHDDFTDEESDTRIFHCVNCHPVYQCPYEIAKDEAANARLAILNTAYFLAETEYNEKKTKFAHWPLLIIDEADKLEDELMGFVEVSIGPRVRKSLGVGLPEKKTVDEAWVEWLQKEVLPAIENKTKELSSEMTLIPDLKVLRQKKRLRELKQKVGGLLALEIDEETGESRPVLQSGWVYTGYEGEEESKITVTFKPISVSQYGQELLFSKADRIVLMSATFVSPEQTAEELGIEEGAWTVVEMPSSFPPLRRPIYPRSIAAVSNKTKETSIPLVAEAVAEVCHEFPNERILVHTVSYLMTRAVASELMADSQIAPRVVTYNQPWQRDSALARYLARPASVLLAPSFDRGVDLKDDDCRVVVVAKVPYPNLGDKQISARLYSTGRAGRLWFKVQSIRTICQMTGRGMRSKDDWCVSIILDSEFDRLYRENRSLFPSWWSEAVVWDKNDPKWREVVA